MKILNFDSSIATVSAGTAAAPSISFANDPNTGIYSPGADQVAISTGGTGRLFVDASGNVGIGQSSITAVFGRTISATGSGGATYRVAGTSTSAYLFTSDGLGYGGFFQETNHPLILGTNSQERLRITSAGLVGIGTVSPAYKLHVSGTTSLIKGDSVGASSIAPSLDLYDSTHLVEVILTPASGTGIIGTYSNHPFTFYTNNQPRATIDTSGRLLVGTSTPVGTDGLQLKGPVGGNAGFRMLGGNTASLTSNQAIAQINFTDGYWGGLGAQITATADAAQGNGDYPTRLEFSTTSDASASPTERLRITSAGVLQVADAGNIAVGTTTGTKIGTATTQKLGFFNATPVVQPAAVADATDAATVITQLNDLLAKLRTLGIIAT